MNVHLEAYPFIPDLQPTAQQCRVCVMYFVFAVLLLVTMFIPFFEKCSAHTSPAVVKPGRSGSWQWRSPYGAYKLQAVESAWEGTCTGIMPN